METESTAAPRSDSSSGAPSAPIPAALWSLMLVTVLGAGMPELGVLVSVPLGGLLVGVLARSSPTLTKWVSGAAVLAAVVLVLAQDPSSRGEAIEAAALFCATAGFFASLGWFVSAPGRTAGELLAALVVGIAAGLMNVGLAWGLLVELA